jgi:hypothetical protein
MLYIHPSVLHRMVFRNSFVMLEYIQTMRDLLEQQGKCRCTTLEECGKKMFEKQCDTNRMNLR